MRCLDFVRELDALGVAARIAVTFLCGGIIGLEREYKRRSAGFRTHILFCLGASICAMTGEFLAVNMEMQTDVLRLSAQVLVGVGIIGAGCIVVTRQQRVRGLTTAAGLWTTAIIGLAAGGGYIEVAILGTALVLITEFLLTKFEHTFARKNNSVNLYVEYAEEKTMKAIVRIINEKHLTLDDLEISRIAESSENKGFCAVLSLSVSKRVLEEDIIKSISALEGVSGVEEL